MKKILFLIPAFLVLSACQQGISYKKNLPVDEAMFKETDLIEKPMLVQDEPLIPEELHSSPRFDDKIIHSSLDMNKPNTSADSSVQNAIENLEILPPQAVQETTEEEVLIEAEEVVFNKCGELSEFTNFVWYWELLAKINKEDKFNGFDPIMEDSNITNGVKSKKIRTGDIAQVCASYESGLVLALLSGDNKGNGFHLYGYNRDSQELIDAEREDITQDQAQWTLTPDRFGKRTGLEIALTGERVINQCTETGNFQYNYVKNYIRMTKKCSICPGDTQPICLNYES